jgi:phytoene dehydrogenase-like protein
MSSPDVIVIGGGHNGLVAAAMLSRRGVKAMVLERRDVVGGGAVTEEFHPGFRSSTIAHTAGPLRPWIAKELGLSLDAVSVEPRIAALLPGGRGLAAWGDPERSAEEIRPFSEADARRYPEFHRSLGRVAALLARAIDATPPDVDAPGAREAWGALGGFLAVRGLGPKDGRRLLRWPSMAVSDFASEWFDSEPLRALVAARGVWGRAAGPRSPGTTGTLLLAAATSGGNGAGSTVLVRGGLGAFASALAAAAQRSGAVVRTGAEVSRILVEGGEARGVVLAGGEEIRARAVVSAVDVQRTVLGMLDPLTLDPDELRRVRNFQQCGVASKVNLAVGGPFPFKLRSARGDELSPARVHIAADMDALERAYDASKYGAISESPYLDVVVPTAVDPSLAPAGHHVLSVYVQYTPYRLKSGDWDGQREALGDLVVRRLEEVSPGISGRIVARQVLTPLDLERTYGFTGGHPFHGELALHQAFLTRPLLGWGRYRTPVRGLYLCSASSHPGGGLTGASGANAAREILKDLG